MMHYSFAAPIHPVDILLTLYLLNLPGPFHFHTFVYLLPIALLACLLHPYNHSGTATFPSADNGRKGTKREDNDSENTGHGINSGDAKLHNSNKKRTMENKCGMK